MNEFTPFGRLVDAPRPWLRHAIIVGGCALRDRIFRECSAASRLPSLCSALRGLDPACALQIWALIGATHLNYPLLS